MNTAAIAVTLLAALLTAATTVSSAAAPPPVDCMSVAVSMTDCLSFVTNGSTVTKPEGNCCSGLKSVLKTNPECLCQAFKSSAQFGVVLNVSKALSLPSACHVHAPNPSHCGLSLAPAGAPAGAAVSPAGAPSTTSVAGAPTMGFGSSEMSPAAAPAKTGASSAISVSVGLIVAGIAAVFFSSF